MHNALFWVRYIRKHIIPHFEHLEKTFTQRILPTFETVESEAEQVSNKKWEQLIHQPGDPDEDLSDLAEEALEEGISYYITMMGIRQGLLNIFAVGIWHLFEQELLFIHRKELLLPQEENNAELFKLSEIKRRLKQTGIDIEKFRSWNKLEELRLVANTVKHADGISATQLKKRRPNMFIPPEERDDPFWGHIPPPTQIFKPLAGEDLYLTPGEIKSYFQAVKDFWDELMENLGKGES
jgi:hypothetical protein